MMDNNDDSTSTAATLTSNNMAENLKLNLIPAHAQNEVLFFGGCLPGELDGDGTWCGVVHAKNITSPTCNLALLKDVDQSPMKKMVQCMFPQDVSLHLSETDIKIVLTSNSLC
jgi:hypothetical protein